MSNKSNKNINKRQITKQGHIVVYMFLAIISIISMFFLAYNNSPFVERIGEDGGMYLVIGRDMADGIRLYADLFDHKGPLIFLLNAIPQFFIEGTIGVWILEILFLFVSLVILYKIGLIILNNNVALGLCIIYPIIMCYVFNGGNYTEEYSNLFSLCAIYIFVRWIDGDCKKVSALDASILGMCMAFTFFLRPNNMVIICVTIAFIFIHSIFKSPKYIIGYILYGFLGICIILIPIIVIHLIHGTLYDMFYATVLHNLEYCKNGWNDDTDIQTKFLTSFKKILIIYNVIIGYALFKLIRNKRNLYALYLGVSTIMCNISVLLGGHDFKYYLAIEAPVVAVAIAFIYRYCNKTIKNYYDRHCIRLVIELSVVFSILIVILMPKLIRLKNDTNDYKEACIQLNKEITYGKDDIFGYDIPAPWYYFSDIKPNFKYFTMQNWMSRTNSDINKEIIEYVEENHPAWIISYGKSCGGNEELRSILESEYELSGSSIIGYLYRYINYDQ